jgi:hypothetical protein
MASYLVSAWNTNMKFALPPSLVWICSMQFINRGVLVAYFDIPGGQPTPFGGTCHLRKCRLIDMTVLHSPCH